MGGGARAFVWGCACVGLRVRCVHVCVVLV